jgi:hypothetical protein
MEYPELHFKQNSLLTHELRYWKGKSVNWIVGTFEECERFKKKNTDYEYEYEPKKTEQIDSTTSGKFSRKRT